MLDGGNVVYDGTAGAARDDARDDLNLFFHPR
jgi:hypothetical protein